MEVNLDIVGGANPDLGREIDFNNNSNDDDDDDDGDDDDNDDNDGGSNHGPDIDIEENNAPDAMGEEEMQQAQEYTKQHMERMLSGWCSCSFHAQRNLEEEDGSPDTQSLNLGMGEMISRLCKLKCENENDSSEASSFVRVPDALSSREFLTRTDELETLPWRELLAGGDHPPTLSFLKSERPVARIHRTWDVDSFIARVESLAVHQEGFRLSYTPKFSRRLTQDVHVRINNKTLHQMKHIRLGHGVLSPEYNCFVFFPNMPVKKVTHLRHDELRQWVDEIILPSLRATANTSILQHHPRSYNEAYLKANVSSKERLNSKYQLDPHEIVPGNILDQFWRRVLSIIQQHSDTLEVFSSPILILDAYNIKLLTKAHDFRTVRAAYQQMLERRFNFDHFDFHQTWVDVGIEDTPDSGKSGRPTTLLRRMSCLTEWSKQLEGFRPQFYNWQLTRDSGDIRGGLTAESKLRRGGLMYAQSYNLNKNLFFVPIKNHKPFKHSHLEGLPFSTELMSRCYSAGQQTRNAPREQIRNMYLNAKHRVESTLKGAEKFNFGVREEYRVQWQLFQSLDPVYRPFLRPGQHLPFWQLSTRTTHQFMKAEVNRWLVGI